MWEQEIAQNSRDAFCKMFLNHLQFILHADSWAIVTEAGRALGGDWRPKTASVTCTVVRE